MSGTNDFYSEMKSDNIIGKFDEPVLTSRSVLSINFLEQDEALSIT